VGVDMVGIVMVW